MSLWKKCVTKGVSTVVWKAVIINKHINARMTSFSTSLNIPDICRIGEQICSNKAGRFTWVIRLFTHGRIMFPIMISLCGQTFYQGIKILELSKSIYWKLYIFISTSALIKVGEVSDFDKGQELPWPDDKLRHTTLYFLTEIIN